MLILKCNVWSFLLVGKHFTFLMNQLDILLLLAILIVLDHEILMLIHLLAAQIQEILQK